MQGAYMAECHMLKMQCAHVNPQLPYIIRFTTGTSPGSSTLQTLVAAHRAHNQASGRDLTIRLVNDIQENPPGSSIANPFTSWSDST